MGNTFGHLFRITTFGESHGPGVGVVVDGCPPGLDVGEEAVQVELDRRRPGQSRLVTQRDEPDRVEILSGIFEGTTTGAPICMLVRNRDARSGAYEEMRETYRPSHADYTYDAKYGVRDWKGGGRASARETVGRVAGGAVARILLRDLAGAEIVAWVQQVHDIVATIDPRRVTRRQVERTPVRCPDPEAAPAMIEKIEAIRAQGDSLGGVVGCVARNVPPGLGEPVFDRIEADLARAMLSLPATKGFEIGSGFDAVLMTGSEHNDPFVMRRGRVRTRTNRSGGVQGGITNGEPVVFRVAFKPTATIMRPQTTVTRAGKNATLAARGRHDPCVLPRAVPIVEAMTALVLADHYLRQRAINPESLEDMIPGTRATGG